MSDYKYEIESIMGILNEPNDKGWCKAILKISWNDNIPQIDIRNICIVDGKVSRVSKGICLSDEQTDNLITTLLKNGYLTDDEIKKIMIDRNNVYRINSTRVKSKIKILAKKLEV